MDERLEKIEAEKNQALEKTTNEYQNMINEADSKYQGLIDAAQSYADTQTDLQNQQTEQTINEINQNKEKTNRDYQREQRGAYQDYEAEKHNEAVQLRAMGLNNTGYSETTISNMYNTYQNRVATARESFNDAMTNYDNQIANARIANSSKLAEIAFQALQQQAEYTLQAFTYKNGLTQTLLQQQNQINSDYWGRYKDIQSQINYEKQQKEAIRQYNQEYALKKAQSDASVAHTNAQTRLLNQQYENNKPASIKNGSGGTSIDQKIIDAKSSKNLTDNQKSKVANIDDSTAYGNNASTVAKDDYYFSNGYQPAYLFNKKLVKAAMGGNAVKWGNIDPNIDKAHGNQSVWGVKDNNGNNRFFVWDGSSMNYIEVTDSANKYLKAAENNLGKQTSSNSTSNVAGAVTNAASFLVNPLAYGISKGINTVVNKITNKK